MNSGKPGEISLGTRVGLTVPFGRNEFSCITLISRLSVFLNFEITNWIQRITCLSISFSTSYITVVSGKIFTDFYFRGSGRSNLQFCYLVHILCSYMRQHECDDVLDGFWGPGDGCYSDTGSDTVPGQIFVLWDSFANNIMKIWTLQK